MDFCGLLYVTLYSVVLVVVCLNTICGFFYQQCVHCALSVNFLLCDLTGLLASRI